VTAGTQQRTIQKAPSSAASTKPTSAFRAGVHSDDPSDQAPFHSCLETHTITSNNDDNDDDDDHDCDDKRQQRLPSMLTMTAPRKCKCEWREDGGDTDNWQ
jgi:hypothetical protein